MEKDPTQGNNVLPVMLHATDVSVLNITGPNVSPAEVTTSMQSLETTDHQDCDDDAYSDPVYLNTVTNQQTLLTNSWTVQVTTVNKKVLFKVDTGAEVTAMSVTAMSDSAW